MPPVSKAKVVKDGPKWTWSRQIFLGAVTGILAYALAVKVTQDKHARGRAYSNSGKFKQPRYASLLDMESVSNQYSIVSRLDIPNFEAIS